MTSLQAFIDAKRQSTPQLLMTHVVYGYPTIDMSLQIMRLMLEQGVELLEVQFPFSDPVADGPTITTACHEALQSKLTVSQCIADISRLGTQYPQSRVVLMSYLNPLLQVGFDELAAQMQPAISGLIVPDLPVDHADMLVPVAEKGASSIWMITPDMSDQRVQKVTEHASGMLYCVSRSGVTGESDKTACGIKEHLARIRQQTAVPLGVGFGINSAADILRIKDHADIAIVGSAFLTAFNQGGLAAVSEKLKALAA